MSVHDVVIVGLGPVGAALAARLRTLGVGVVVLEAETTPHAQPRAAHFDDDALRVLQSVGVLDGVLAHGRPLDGFDLVDAGRRTLLRARKRVAWPRSLPSALLVHQPTVEIALRERLAGLGAEVRLGHHVADVTPSDEGVTVEGASANGRFAVRARVVVGCDGARSRVRERMGSPLRGGRFEERWLVVDALVPEGDPLPDRLLQIADARQPATYVPFPGRRRRWEFRLDPSADADAETSAGSIRDRLAPWLDPSTVEIERATVYTFHDLVAQGWRRGRVLIAGDAAHQMPPFLGQGLGTGMHDAATLAWMLALVLRGEASWGLLDAYEAERRPHVARVTRLAVRLGRIVSASGARAQVRDALLRTAHGFGLGERLRAIEAPLPRVQPVLDTSGSLPRHARLPQPLVGYGATTVRLDDRLGPGFAVLGLGLDARRWAGPSPIWDRIETTFVTVGADVWDPSGTLARWAGDGPTAVVVRPDRIAFGVYGPDEGVRAASDLARALHLR